MKKIFGTDGVRGVYKKYPLINSVILSLCDGLDALLTSVCNSNSDKKGKILIGVDSRSSGKEILSILSYKFADLEFDVFFAGKITTPTLSAVLHYKLIDEFDYGIMITASHNTYEYNGLKIFDKNGKKISHQSELFLENFVKNHMTHVSADMVHNFVEYSHDMHLIEYNLSSTRQTNYTDISSNIKKQYISLVSKVAIKKCSNMQNPQIKILIDCANGVTSFFAKEILQSILFNYSVQIIEENIDTDHDEMLNRNASVLDESVFAEKMKNTGADIGFAFDGDGDRVMCMNKNLNLIDGDQILGLFAMNFDFLINVFKNFYDEFMSNYCMKTNQHPQIVITIDSNSSFMQFLESIGVKYYLCNVGDKNVEQHMKTTHSIIGGESSGHILTPINPYCGDGILISVLILKIILENNHLNFHSILCKNIFECNEKYTYKISNELFDKFAYKYKKEIDHIADKIWNLHAITTGKSFEQKVNYFENPSFKDVYMFYDGKVKYGDFATKDDVKFIATCEFLQNLIFQKAFQCSCSDLLTSAYKNQKQSIQCCKKIIIRHSGTEPIVRINIEMSDEYLNCNVLSIDNLIVSSVINDIFSDF